MAGLSGLHYAAAAGAVLLGWLGGAAIAGPAMVIESPSGLVLYSEDEDKLWHPASLTKLMTAYLTFEAIRDGKLSLEDTLQCSAHALVQPPTKIGLPEGGQLKVDMGLRALIVKSANDVAVMLAEKIAGSEAAFVEKMNDTAKRLGMSKTRFYNANGLHHEQQVTTARDMALLAKGLLKEFPEHAHFYALESFKLGRRNIRTHNGLLRTFAGSDGMKTGFICASGYNVVASATRDGRQIVAVVLGEPSGAARSARAAALIEYGFEHYWWKTLFSASIGSAGAGEGAALTQAPPDLRPLVCGRRRAVRKRKPRRQKARQTAQGPKAPAAARPGN